MLKKISPVLALAALIALFAVACGESAPAAAPTPTATRSSPSPVPKVEATATSVSQANESTETGSTTPAGPVTEVKLQDPGASGKYQFAPAKLSFKVGEAVNFKLMAETEFHTFTADDLKIDQSVDAGQTVEFSHTFDKAGTFKLYCIPHESLGMVGEITVQ